MFDERRKRTSMAMSSRARLVGFGHCKVASDVSAQGFQ